MTHDPLCPMSQSCPRGPHHMLGNPLAEPSYCDPCGAECDCALIARVQEDESSTHHGAASGGMISRGQAKQIAASIGQHGCLIRH